MNEYTILVIPPKEIIDKVDKYRNRFAKYTSYVIPPHLTIYPPFFNQLSTEAALIEQLRKAFSSSRPATISLKNIGFFEGSNKVAFIEPDKPPSEFLLNLLITTTDCLKGKVKKVYEDYNFTLDKFKPHMTIAEKVPDDKFKTVKKELQNLEIGFSFLVDSVYLYRQEKGSNIWKEAARIGFS